MVALRYSSGCRGLGSRWSHSGRPVTLVLTHPLIELNTRDISWGYKRSVSRDDNFADCLQILGASTSWSPKDLPRPLQG